MKDTFYNHIVTTHTVHHALHNVSLEPHEKHELVTLVETHVHYVVLDTVLSELEESDKKQFLSHVHQKKHDKVWELLNARIDQIEDKILTAVQSLIEELHRDIEEAKQADLHKNDSP
ncbi:MAG: hypothetical protein ACOCXQ_02080 [Patescibacteria group bacterium]